MKYSRYASYKESGVEWLGEIPAGWGIKKLKYNLTLQTEKVSINKQKIIALENIEGWSGKLVKTDSKYTGDDVAFQKDDILFGKLRPYLAKVYKCPNSGVAFGDILVYRPYTNIVSQYAFYSLISEGFIDIVDGSTYGSKMPRASVEFISNMPIATAPKQEQQTIANYLDKATAKIDALIAKQTKLIALLKEKRQVVISTAVTRGLDSTVAMKDSGVKWLGEIPEHWVASRLKHFTRQIIDGAHFTPTYIDTGIPFLRVTDLHNEEINLDKVKFIPLGEHKDLIRRCKPERGDLLLSKNGTIGLTKIIDWDWEFSIFVSLCLIKFQVNKMQAKFFLYIFQSSAIEEQLFHSSKKTSVTNLHLDKINELYFSIPSTLEQDGIVTYLDIKTKKIDTLINKSTQAIDLLKEKRTALISAAVTGKIDVRALA